MTTGARASVARWTTGPLPPDVELALDRLAASEGIAHVAVMPDVHLSREFCIGTVVAARARVYPAAVGGDIGCGMAVQRFRAAADDVLADPASARRILRALKLVVPVHRHARATMVDELPDSLEAGALSSDTLTSKRRRNGRAQFATLGRGNHFLELQSDDEGALWLMVHSGSRGVGHAIAHHHMSRCETESGGLTYLDPRSPAGAAYLADVGWARAYAHESRLGMIEAVEAVLGELFGVEPDPASRVSADHNHVRVERHFGEDLWVHRKGALPAGEGEPGIVPGSMGTGSFHTEGRGCAEALRSSSHGAGRRLSRTEARKDVRIRDFRRQMAGVWYDETMERRLVDEAPAAYKDVEAVMRAQRPLTRIVRRLRPRLVHKG